METYEKITTTHQTFILRINDETARWLIGTEVRKDGDEVQPVGADERKRFVEKSAIRQRIPLVWNLHYGQLEEVSS